MLRKMLGQRGRVAAWRSLGADIGAKVTISSRTYIRWPQHVSIGYGSRLGGKVQIDAWEKVTIGRCVMFNDRVDLLTASHKIDTPGLDGDKRPIVIGDWVWLPVNIMVLRGVTIGRAAVVGSGSVVTKDVAELTVVAGNPARVVGQRADIDFNYLPLSR